MPQHIRLEVLEFLLALRLRSVPISDPLSLESIHGRFVHADLAIGAQSFAGRSSCGRVRGWPEFNSHFSPGAAPHVGQRRASCFSTRYSSFGMLER